MVVAIIIIILIGYFLYIIRKQYDYIGKLIHDNLELRQVTNVANSDKNRYKRLLKELEKVVYLNDYRNENSQMKEIKEILIQSKR